MCRCIAFTEDMTGGKALLSDKIIYKYFKYNYRQGNGNLDFILKN